MAKFLKLGFDDTELGTLREEGGKLVADGPQKDTILSMAEAAAMAIAQDAPNAHPDTLTPLAIMERLARTMQGRSHAVWSE